MKIQKSYWRNPSTLLFVLAFVYVFTLSSCKKDKDDVTPVDPDPEPTAAEKAVGLLTKGNATWPLASVTIDGENGADLFKDFSIKFTATGYTTTGTTPVWARTGTWSFVDPANPTKFKREDNVEVTIVTLTETQLKVTLNWDQTTHTGGRSQSLKGKHEFVLNK